MNNQEPHLPRLRPLGVDAKQSPNAQDTFWPILGCTGVTGSVGITCHACAAQMAGLRSSQSHSLVAWSCVLYMYTLHTRLLSRQSTGVDNTVSWVRIPPGAAHFFLKRRESEPSQLVFLYCFALFDVS